MKISLLATTFVLFSVSTSCSKKEKKEAAPPAVADPEPTPVQEGEPDRLSIALLSSATNIGKTGMDWGEALSNAEKRLGKATTVHGAEYRWGAREGESCAYLGLEMLSGDGGARLGVVQGPMTVKQGESEADWNRCLDSVGAEGAPEDPGAPDAPEAGAVVSVADILAGVEGKPESWVGADVSVKGFYVSASGAFVEDQKTTSLTISETKGSSKGSIGCTFAAGESVPELKEWDELTVRGTVHASFGGGLEACQLVPESEAP